MDQARHAGPGTIPTSVAGMNMRMPAPPSSAAPIPNGQPPQMGGPPASYMPPLGARPPFPPQHTPGQMPRPFASGPVNGIHTPPRSNTPQLLKGAYTNSPQQGIARPPGVPPPNQFAPKQIYSPPPGLGDGLPPRPPVPNAYSPHLAHTRPGSVPVTSNGMTPHHSPAFARMPRPPPGRPIPGQAGGAAPSLLPLPGGYQRSAPGSTANTPVSSEPPSAKSSRNPSPVPTPRYDYMEGQFPSTGPSPAGSVTNLQALGQQQQPRLPGPPLVGDFQSASTLQHAPPKSQSTPVQSMGVPQQVTGAPPLPAGLQSSRAPPQSVGGLPQTSMGGPPTTWVPPQHTGAPPLVTGAPPQFQTAAPPRSMGGPPLSTGAPPQTMEVPPHNVGASVYSPAGPPQMGGLSQPPPMGGPQLSVAPPSQPLGAPFKQMTAPPSQQSFPNQVPSHQQQHSSMGPPQVNSTPNENFHSRRYPTQVGYHQSQGPPQSYGNVDGLASSLGGLSVTQTGFNKLWGLETYDLLQTRNILPPEKVQPPRINLQSEHMSNTNCSPDVFRCTLTKVPESNSLLQKSRLPLGILIHPFKDLNHLPVIQCNTIVRCRACRTYINPFVFFVDQRRWKCNLCFRINELPEEFQYDPVTKSYGDPSRRPEVKAATIEFIAPSEYMLRPPQPAVYLFVLDVSHAAVETGYLRVVCDTLLEELDNLPGDSRTQIGVITFDGTIHFYSLAEGLNQPHQMVVSDIEDVFLPCPDNLLVNMHESKELIKDLLTQLPNKFYNTNETQSVLGAALQAAYKLLAPTGGRVTVFQTSLPTIGPGALQSREDPNQRAGKDAAHLNPANDFYKRLALDCSGQQVAVDLFMLSSQYVDVATLAGISRFSGGSVYYLSGFQASSTVHSDLLEKTFRRYLTRKIGFEAVMRIRCSRGLTIHTFHGNFFVRSTDLLSLPNINPDAGFGMQVSIEENLSDLQSICFQAALLYTSSKGERRIRVHTLCLPLAATLTDVMQGADQQCIIGLLSKMAVDRSLSASLSDARDAFINVVTDVLSAYSVTQSMEPGAALLAPHNLRLLPLYILALLKQVAFRSGQSTRLDDRAFAMLQMKTLPLDTLIQYLYPDLYPIHELSDQGAIQQEGGVMVPQPPRQHLSAEKLDARGVFLLDWVDRMIIYIGRNVPPEFLQATFGLPSFSAIPEEMPHELPEIETPQSERLRNFVNYLQGEKPYPAALYILREDSRQRSLFLQALIEDRSESALSYYEFLQHIKSQIK